ncbi:MAG: hypothetical protein JSS51_13125 [Planctomycetes bacterium]|nr:hypothetical protein [Planctomycetota bacterium]
MSDENNTPPEDSGTPAAETTRPPTSEEIDWRARALAAESRLSQLESEATKLRDQLAAAGVAIQKEQQARAIDRALTDSGVIDAEVAALMLDAMLAASPEPPDIPNLVQSLRTQKPFLFQSALPRPLSPSAMSPAITTTPSEELDTLATQARTGDRRSLLAYLRARRPARGI